VAVNILLFFYKKKTKQNKKYNKILPATSACCGAVVKMSVGIISLFSLSKIRDKISS
jgi:hypothetical protein